jgi:hypothetical protein
MIKHIVFWKLKDEVKIAALDDTVRELKSRLENLKSRIPEIQSLEVGKNANTAGAAWDVALYSEFGDISDLEKYQRHPEHLKVAEYLKSIVSDRAVVDYRV